MTEYSNVWHNFEKEGAMSKFGNPYGEYEPLWIKEGLEEYDISQAEIARRLNLTPS